MVMLDRLANYSIVALVAAGIGGGAAYYVPTVFTGIIPVGHDGRAAPTPAVVTPLPAVAVVVTPPTHSVSWFKAHPSERKAKLAWCHDHSGQWMQPASECTEADDADRQVGVNVFWDNAMKRARQ
jgi:hypothetical protein